MRGRNREAVRVRLRVAERSTRRKTQREVEGRARSTRKRSAAIRFDCRADLSCRRPRQRAAKAANARHVVTNHVLTVNDEARSKNAAARRLAVAERRSSREGCNESDYSG